MSAGEIAAVTGKAIEVVGKKALGTDEMIKDRLLQAAEGTPELVTAGRALAAREAVKQRVLLKLYQPFARMIGVSKAYFEDRFPEEMAARTASIPDEHMITPPPSVAVPAMQGLAYSFEESNLRDLYLNLLTTASDDRRTGDAHPAFADVIKQLTSAEAKLLNTVFAGGGIPIARVKRVDPDGGYHLVTSHLFPLVDSATAQAVEDPQTSVWLDNWARLGLMKIDYASYLNSAEAYDWVTARPEYLRLDQSQGVFEIEKGLLERTAFGERFYRAVAPPEIAPDTTTP